MIPRFIFGCLLGGFFYGGLWLTVRCLPAARHPFVMMLGSLLVRTAVTLAGLFLIIGGHWQNAIVALIGFTAARFLLRFERSRRCT